MDDKNGFVITNRDRILRAWENSTELVRDYQSYSHQIDNRNLSKLFSQYAEDEALHAAKLLKILQSFE